MPPHHPLDRAAWSALNGRHAGFAHRHGGALRYDPAIGVFAAVPDGSPASLADLAALVALHGDVALLEPDPPVIAAGTPGLAVVSDQTGVQMVAVREMPAPDLPGAEPLGDADAAEMLALATLTAPGPFFAQTHRLGNFVGIRHEGRLIAMAGERMKPDGHAEVSGVCTHPDHRGQGHARALIALVARRIQDRGETPFLHAYASNTGAIALYESLGFALRREVRMVRLTRGWNLIQRC